MLGAESIGDLNSTPTFVNENRRLAHTSVRRYELLSGTDATKLERLSET